MSLHPLPLVTAPPAGSAPPSPPWRQLLAESIGTALLAVAVVGSGIMAANLTPDAGLRLLANSVATALALAVLITILAPVSGAHLNPVVSLADWSLGRAPGTGLAGRMLAGYLLAQVAGAISGTILANLMFAQPAIATSGTDRTGIHQWLSEAIATSGLVLLIFALSRTGRTTLTPAAVGGYIGAAYWFTSSTSFANPALTLGRIFTDTLAGIAPASVPGFITAQLIGLILGIGLVLALYPTIGHPTTAHPTTARSAGEVRHRRGDPIPDRSPR